MLFMVIVILSLAALLIVQEKRISGAQVSREGQDKVVETLRTRLSNERAYNRKTYQELIETQDRLGYVSNAQADGQKRLNAMGHDLESMTDQRDELLARVIFDETELETYFEDMEDAEAFLAKRKRAMKSLRQVMRMDLSGPEWDDDHVTEDLDSQLLKITEEPFPHCTAADTIKARDELMQGFDNKETE